MWPGHSAAIRAAASRRNSSYTSGKRSAAARRSPAAAASRRRVTSDIQPSVTAGRRRATRKRSPAISRVTGRVRKTYEKAKQVVEAAEAEPEKFGDLPAKMDAESISAAHAELKQRQEPECEPAGEDEQPEPESTLRIDRRPAWMRKSEGGNKQDPNHPFADVLKAMTALTKAVNKAIAGDETGRLRENLSYLSKYKFKVLMVAHTGAGFKDGKSVPAMAKFVGLQWRSRSRREDRRRKGSHRPRPGPPRST